MSISRAHVYVYGIVHGVCFRASTRDQARSYGIKGWVKNCEDGGVEALFEGEKDTVDKIVSWCRKGPDGAFVRRMDVLWEKYSNEFSEFSIVY